MRVALNGSGLHFFKSFIFLERIQLATGVNQEAAANLRKQIAKLSHDLVEFRIDHVSTKDKGAALFQASLRTKR